MYRISIGRYTVSVASASGPVANDLIACHALLHDDLSDPSTREDRWCWFAVERSTGEVLLSVTATGEATGGPDVAGIQLIPETDRLLVAAADTLACYDLAQPRRLWRDRAFWFRRWLRCGDVLLMQAEYELAAYDLSGDRLWSTQADFPYELEFTGTRLRLVSPPPPPPPDGAGYVPEGSFELRRGPDAPDR